MWTGNAGKPAHFVRVVGAEDERYARHALAWGGFGFCLPEGFHPARKAPTFRPVISGRTARISCHMEHMTLMGSSCPDVTSSRPLDLVQRAN